MSIETLSPLAQALRFDNQFTKQLPDDPELRNFPRQVSRACYSRVRPIQAKQPRLISYSPEMAVTLGLGDDLCKSAEFLEVFSGRKLLEGMDPHACCYGGHQFGGWAGQLGDGRAINLGEVLVGQGKGDRWHLQLKGAGPTPYSRTADGFAVLRSSIREYLCSEAMFHLGVPTTRALCLIATGQDVPRDMFYDGQVELEPGAIVCRVAPSFLRFGNFELLSARKDQETLRRLLDFSISMDFPDLAEEGSKKYVAWFQQVCKLTADMIVHWMRVGFVHGVMNTDNMSILGLTIDYGPYGWIDNFDPDWTPNTTDAQTRRYRFGNQPGIAQWNLAQLANSICGIVGQTDPLEQALESFAEYYEMQWTSMMMNKLGLDDFAGQRDRELLQELHEIMQLVETDMTLFFRQLATISTDELLSCSELDSTNCMSPWQSKLEKAFYPNSQSPMQEKHRQQINQWMLQYGQRQQSHGLLDEDRIAKMNRYNPKFVLRNYLAQEAIEKATMGDYSRVNELLEVLRSPYSEQSNFESQYAARRPDWARHKPGCSMLSCSS